jgi:hypothetical protein
MIPDNIIEERLAAYRQQLEESCNAFLRTPRNSIRCVEPIHVNLPLSDLCQAQYHVAEAQKALAGTGLTLQGWDDDPRLVDLEYFADKYQFWLFEIAKTLYSANEADGIINEDGRKDFDIYSRRLQAGLPEKLRRSNQRAARRRLQEVLRTTMTIENLEGLVTCLQGINKEYLYTVEDPELEMYLVSMRGKFGSTTGK